MYRLISLLGTLCAIAVGCGQSGDGSVDPASDDEYYTLYLAEVLVLGEAWWGYPPPSDYCVAIAPGSDMPELEEARDPTHAVMDSLAALHPSKTFHPYSQCPSDFPFTTPAGDTAGLVWAKPIEVDRSAILGGWLGPRDATEWGCTFREADGAVQLENCELRSET